MALPLEGIRVVDWTIWQQGPVASLMLGDFGAEVIKIEAREGDPGRGILRAQGLDLTDRPNFYFEANNRNKKSLAVDLKKPEGVEIVRRIADRADVFVQNFRKGVAARLGLDAPTLRARNRKRAERRLDRPRMDQVLPVLGDDLLALGLPRLRDGHREILRARLRAPQRA